MEVKFHRTIYHLYFILKKKKKKETKGKEKEREIYIHTYKCSLSLFNIRNENDEY